MTLWLEKLAEVATSGEAAILATVLEAKGSTPRGVGTKMVVTAQGGFATVGGGNLEHQCIGMAQERLKQGRDAAWLRTVHRFPLGASLGQCCGGFVVMLLEYIDHKDDLWISQLQMLKNDQQCNQLQVLDNDQQVRGLWGSGNSQQESLLVTPLHNESAKLFIRSAEEAKSLTASRDNYFIEKCTSATAHIMLFGAGHVGRALVKALVDIDCQISWVDSRAEQFPAELPANTRMIITDHPEDEVKDAPSNTYFLVMTHSHPLDQAICEKILSRVDAKFCGLIGSFTKKRKFEHRLKARGLSDSAIANLTCPIGIAGISGKEPAVIAVSVTAQLLTLIHYERVAQKHTASQPLVGKISIV